MIRIVFIITFIISSLLSHAQSKQWSLEECMTYAVENNYSVIRADFNQKNAKLGYTNSLLSQLPSINASVGAGSSWGSNIDPGTNTINKANIFNNSLSAGINLPIFDGLSMTNATRTNKIAMLSGVEEKRQLQDKVALDCMLAYIEVVYNKSLIALTEEKLENSRLNFRKTSRLEELGVSNSADVAQIEAEVASEELALITRQNKLETIIIKLKDLMNYPLDRQLDISDNIPLTDIIDNDKNSTEIYANALKTLPEAMIGEYNLEKSRLKLQTAKWSLLPRISANYGIQSRYYSPINSTDPIANYGQQIDGNFGQGLSLSMSIPIFNGLDNITNLKKAKNNYALAQNDWNETQRKIQSEIEQAVMDCSSAEKQWQQAEKSAKATELAHRANQRKYDEGMIGIIEYQISANKLLLSKAEAVYSRLRYTALCKQVNYYKGVSYF